MTEDWRDRPQFWRRGLEPDADVIVPSRIEPIRPVSRGGRPPISPLREIYGLGGRHHGISPSGETVDVDIGPGHPLRKGDDARETERRAASRRDVDVHERLPDDPYQGVVASRPPEVLEPIVRKVAADNAVRRRHWPEGDPHDPDRARLYSLVREWDDGPHVETIRAADLRGEPYRRLADRISEVAMPGPVASTVAIDAPTEQSWSSPRGPHDHLTRGQIVEAAGKAIMGLPVQIADAGLRTLARFADSSDLSARGFIGSPVEMGHDNLDWLSMPGSGLAAGLVTARAERSAQRAANRTAARQEPASGAPALLARSGDEAATGAARMARDGSRNSQPFGLTEMATPEHVREWAAENGFQTITQEVAPPPRGKRRYDDEDASTYVKVINHFDRRPVGKLPPGVSDAADYSSDVPTVRFSGHPQRRDKARQLNRIDMLEGRNARGEPLADPNALRDALDYVMFSGARKETAQHQPGIPLKLTPPGSAPTTYARAAETSEPVVPVIPQADLADMARRPLSVDERRAVVPSDIQPQAPVDPRQPRLLAKSGDQTTSTAAGIARDSTKPIVPLKRVDEQIAGMLGTGRMPLDIADDLGISDRLLNASLQRLHAAGRLTDAQMGTIRHLFESGTTPAPEEMAAIRPAPSKSAPLIDSQVRSLSETGFTPMQIADELGVSDTAVRQAFQRLRASGGAGSAAPEPAASLADLRAAAMRPIEPLAQVRARHRAAGDAETDAKVASGIESGRGPSEIAKSMALSDREVRDAIGRLAASGRISREQAESFGREMGNRGMPREPRPKAERPVLPKGRMHRRLSDDEIGRIASMHKRGWSPARISEAIDAREAQVRDIIANGPPPPPIKRDD